VKEEAKKPYSAGSDFIRGGFYKKSG
jgi:hypothetical protein